MDNALFSPIMCSSETFEKQTPHDGQVYFVTDTKQLHVVRDNKFIELCGGINLVYGKKEISYPNNGKDPDPKVFFYNSDLEDQEKLPLVNDLILNTDGCFYRVKSVANSGFQTERLTLQGTGSGGSGSGSGGGSSSGSFGLDAAYTYIFPDTATEMNVSFTANADTSTTTATNYIAKVTFTLYGESSPFLTKSGLYLEMNKKHTIDLYNYKSLFSAASKDVTIKVYDKYGVEREDILSVQVINLQLVTTNDELRQVASTLSYTYTLDGAKSLISPKIVYEFYGEASADTPVKTIERDAEVGSNKRHELSLADLSSGAYTMKVYGQGEVAGFTLTSNSLTHSLIIFKEGTVGSILAVLMPEKVEQYTDTYFKFLIVSDSTDTQTVTMSINGTAQDSIEATPGEVSEFVSYFDTAGEYTLSFNTSSGLSKTYNISVVAYDGELPIIKPNDARLMLYLTPRGRSNDSTTRDEWNDSSLLGAAANGVGHGKLSGLYYGTANGWLRDDDGTPYLKLTSGATYELTDFEPFRFDPTEDSKNYSDWQAIKMGSGFTVELDIELNGIIDYDENIIECIGLGQNRKPCVGFKMTGKTVRMLNSRLNGVDVITDEDGNVLENTILPLTIIEGKRMRISYVVEPKKNHEFPMCIAYINGVLSGATIYKTDDKYVDVATPAQLKINSASAEVKVYGIRIYSDALEPSDILNNYTASLATLTDREEAYKNNDVFNAITSKVDIDKVRDKAYNIQIPYMILTGGYPTTENNKWQLQSVVKDSDIHLPTGKKDYRLVDIEIHYPNTKYFETGLGKGLAGTSRKYTNVFENGLGMKDNLGKAPTNGYIVYGQGTSSMEYPVKNLRLRANLKAGSEAFEVRPTIGDVEIVCMKADYMDSSGSHNTGTANLVDDCYAALGLQTPGQKHFDKNGTGSIVTCIKGYPCLIFYSKDGEEYEYVGKYNMNLDKATPEPFGFKNDPADDSFGYLPEGYQYKSGNSDELKTVQPGEKINSIHCYEFLDNATEVCNFLGKKKGEGSDERYDYNDTWYGVYNPTKNEEVYGWTLGFESRYPEDLVGKHDADPLWPLAKWLNELQTLREKEEKGENDYNTPLTPEDIENKITYEITNSDWDKNAQYYGLKEEYIKVSLDKDQYVSGKYYIATEEETYELAESDWAEGTQYYELQKEYIKVYPNDPKEDSNQNPYVPGKYYIITEDKSVFKMTSLQRFKDEYQKYLNKDFLLTYYVLTEALLMVDSRVKNMMLATWGPEEEDGNYIFYPIFYDMDTMLGLDNAGKERFTYYDEDTNANIYNGDCVLWNFVRDALSTEVNAQYNKMETAKILDSDKILDYYNDYQASMANEAFYNGDAQYKYIEPAINGYYDNLGKKDIAPGAAPYLYAGQGNRNMNREYFLDNRIPFLRGKHVSEGFKTQQAIEFRWNYPVEAEGKDALNKSIKAVPPDGKFTFTSMQTCYAGVMLGKNSSGVQSHKFTGEETYELVVPNASSANGTEAYLLGVNGLKDVGDLSSKYMQKFAFTQSKNIKLENLTLGSSKQGYNNTFWAGGGNITLTGCTYLKRFDLRNCPSYMSAIDFTPCPAIETILLTGSSVNGIDLPTNGSLKELRLPPMGNLVIDSHSALTKFSMGEYEYYDTEDLTEEMTDETRYTEDYSKISSITVINTPIDTYRILRSAPNLNDFNIEGFEWEITDDDTQYIKTDDSVAATDKTYYVLDTDGKSYKSFVGVWPTENGKPVAKNFVLEAVKLIDDSGAITTIPLLDKMIKLRETQGDIATKLRGTIVINVKANVNEYAIYSKYHGTLPYVTIKYGSNAAVTEAFRLKFYNLDKFPTKEEIEKDTYNIYYEVPCDSNLEDDYKKLSYLVSAAGPNGKALPTPTKMSSTDWVYTYTGKWKMKKLDENYDSSSAEEVKLDDRIVDGSYVFIPVYSADTRYYSVTFHDYNGQPLNIRSILSSLTQEDYNKDGTPPTNGVIKYTYQQIYSENIYTPLVAYKPDDDLGEEMRWQFRGWISESDYNASKTQDTLVDPKYYDMMNDKVEIDGLKLYPYFEQENCLISTSPAEWFQVDSAANFTVACAEYNSSKGIVQDIDKSFSYSSGKQISFTPQYLPWIQGKVTIPSSIKDSSGKLVVVESFKGRGNVTTTKYNPKFTHVYFLSNSECKYLPDHAFFTCVNLKTVVLPETLVVIGNNAFSSSLLTKLENYSDNDNIQYIGANAFSNACAPAELPSNLVGLGNSAFYSTRFFNNASIDSLPLGITTLGSYVFAVTQCSLWEFGYEQEGTIDGNQNNVKYIGSGTFQGCIRSGSNNILKINKSIEYIAEHNEYIREDRETDSETGEEKTTYTTVIDPCGPFQRAFSNQTFSIWDYSGLIKDDSDFTTKYAGGDLGTKATISSFNGVVLSD